MQTDNTPTTTETNTLAIISLILSLGGIPFLCGSIMLTICGCITGLLAIGAVVTGFIARQQITSNGGQGNEMALIGIILGGIQVVLVAIGVLITLILLAIGMIGAATSS